MNEPINIIDHFEEELEDIKKPSPFRWILGMFLIFIMIMWFVPAYNIQVDPPPTRIPTIEEVSSITEYDRIESNNIQDYVIIDSEIKSVADQIAVIACSSNQKKCQARAMFGFVQENFEYVSDPINQEYWESPKELLIKRGGDCESGTFLLASLIESIGIDSQIVLTNNHAYLRIWLEEQNNFYKKDDGWTYLDWTCKSCDFGEVPWQHAKNQASYIEVP